MPSGQMAARTRWIFGTTWREINRWSFPSWASLGPLTNPISGRERKRNKPRKNHNMLRRTFTSNLLSSYMAGSVKRTTARLLDKVVCKE